MVSYLQLHSDHMQLLSGQNMVQPWSKIPNPAKMGKMKFQQLKFGFIIITYSGGMDILRTKTIREMRNQPKIDCVPTELDG